MRWLVSTTSNRTKSDFGVFPLPVFALNVPSTDRRKQNMCIGWCLHPPLPPKLVLEYYANAPLPLPGQPMFALKVACVEDGFGRKLARKLALAEGGFGRQQRIPRTVQWWE